LRCSFRHPDQVFEIFVFFPIFLFGWRHGVSAAFLDQFRYASGVMGGVAQGEDLFGRGECGEQFENIGRAIEAGLGVGVEFAETQFQDFRKLLQVGANLGGQINNLAALNLPRTNAVAEGCLARRRLSLCVRAGVGVGCRPGACPTVYLSVLIGRL
jgi:hypothetical protein